MVCSHVAAGTVINTISKTMRLLVSGNLGLTQKLVDISQLIGLTVVLFLSACGGGGGGTSFDITDHSIPRPNQTLELSVERPLSRAQNTIVSIDNIHNPLFGTRLVIPADSFPANVPEDEVVLINLKVAYNYNGAIANNETIKLPSSLAAPGSSTVVGPVVLIEFIHDEETALVDLSGPAQLTLPYDACVAGNQTDNLQVLRFDGSESEAVTTASVFFQMNRMVADNIGAGTFGTFLDKNESCDWLAERPDLPGGKLFAAVEDTVLNDSLVAFGDDSTTFTYRSLVDPEHGELVVETNGLITYTPDLNYNGRDEFIYDVFNGYEYTNPATAKIEILAVNDAPVAFEPDAFSIGSTDAAYAGKITGIDVDSKASRLFFQVVAAPAAGTVTMESDGNFQYYPGCANGVISFTARMSDHHDNSNIVTQVINHTCP